jgi:hypothetical protein
MALPDPLAIVLAEHEAYNQQDLHRLMSYYATDAVILDGNGTVTHQGNDAVRSAMRQVFERMPDVHVDWPDIFQVGEWVAVHDVVPNWKFGDAPGEREMQWVALYRVVNGKIKQLQLFS